MRRKLTDEDIVRDVINRMFEIAGYDTCYEDIVGRKDDWYMQWTMTEEQGNIWRQWMIDYFKKECKLPLKLAEQKASMYNLMWGLKYRYEQSR